MIRRKSIWKRLVAACSAVLLLVGVLPTTARADVYWPEGPSIATPCAIVMDVNSGAILYEKNSDMVNYPASITKIMTTMLALEYCELDEIVTFSADAVYKNEGNTSHIARDLNEQMTMEQCLYAVMLESANECAYAVAEHVGAKLGGDYQTFVDLMNERAKELGCKNTHFNNANGLPDNNHVTSAADMAVISAEAYKNETFRIIIGTKNYQIPPTNKHDEITPLNNHHAMLSYYKTNKYLYEYCKGGKTGYTDAAGSTLVTFAENNGLSLVCVVMRTTNSEQYLETTSLFEYCFQNFQACSLADYGHSDETGNKNHGIMSNHESYIDFNEDAYVVLPITADLSDVELQLENMDIPGEVIARLNYIYGGHVVGSVSVVPSGAEVEENYFDNENADSNVIEIKSSTLALIIVILILLGIVIFFGKRLYDNFYVILHDLEVRKQRNSRFRPIRKKKKRWRKKDRMFK